MTAAEKGEKEENDRNQPLLHGKEVRDIERRTAPRAIIVHEAVRLEGEEELKRSSSALAWSGLAAGLSMGFSLVSEGLLYQHLPDAPWRPLLSKFGYSVGFLIVILGRQQLFTENTLTPILPLLHRWRISTLMPVLRLSLIVLAANLTGTLLLVCGLSHAAVFSRRLQVAFLPLSRSPRMRFPTWSWFCANTTNRSAGRSLEALPCRRLRNREYWPE